MDRQILNITANEQILTCDNPIKISTNKVNYIEAHFTLGDNWSGYDSIRAVWFNDFYCISTVLDSNGVAFVPSEVMKRNGKVKVNLVGSISEDDVLTDRLTSYPIVAVIVDCTAQINGAETAPITPSQFEQYVAIVRSLVDSVKDIDHIELNSDYTLTIYYSDGTSDTTGSVRGADGNGIESVTKTGTSGLVDTYTITFTDGQTTTFNVTNGAKGDTGNGIQSIAKTSTIGLVDTYTITYTDGTTTTFTVTNGAKGDKGDTGEVSLSELEQATVVQTLSDNTPYNYRRTNNGNGAGHREYDEIVGASVGWNQLCTLADRTVTEHGTTMTIANGEITISGTPTSSVYFKICDAPIISGHAYSMVRSKAVNGVYVSDQSSPLAFGGYFPWNTYGVAKTVNSVASPSIGIYVSTSFDGTPITFTVGITDLTLMLGSTIADYVYSLEQSTAGSGVAWLKSHFPKLFDSGYQPFDSGSIKSVSGLTAHEMVGKNQWDEEWEVGGFDVNGQKTTGNLRIRSKNPIPILPSTTYYAAWVGSYTSWLACWWYDANGAFIGASAVGGMNRTFTTPSNAHFMNFNTSDAYGATYNNDICINLSDTSINGQYFPHEKHTYTLDSSVTLRGKYVLDNGQLKAVGDVWKADGTVTRNFGVVDLGTLTWTVVAQTAEVNTFGATIDAKPNGGTVANCIVPLYKTVDSSVASLTAEDKVVAITSSGTGLRIRDNSYNSNATAFKTAMSGIYMVYEKATPTTENATAYDNPQWCDANGTEEYIGSELPVGHNTDYPMSLVDTMPTTNGTFEPRVTVTNGVRTVTWVSV